MSISILRLTLPARLTFALCFGIVLCATSCGDSPSQEPDPQPPSIIGPAPATAHLNETLVITFEVTTNDGFATATVTAQRGEVGSPQGMEAGDTSGQITVAFTPNSVGAGLVTLNVTDANGNSDEAIAIVDVLVSDPGNFITGSIKRDTTWATGSIIILKQLVTVEAGATLTIEPGVIVKGEAGAGVNMSLLLVARGGKLNALGTADAPIIFTSIADEIQPGEIVSPNLSFDVRGLWGGVIILGNAPVSSSQDHILVEGISSNNPNGIYGGTDRNDNSGSLQYVSIRHTGAAIQDADRLNGLTLGGVGSGTTINNIEIVGSSDDGLMLLGGQVNVQNVVIWNAEDDILDCDQAYAGTIDNLIGILGEKADHAMELDGPEDLLEGAFTIQNASFKGKGAGNESGGEYADLRYDVQCTLNNIYFFNFDEQSDFEFNDNAVAQNYLEGVVLLSNLQFNVSHLTEGNRTINEIVIEKADTGIGQVPLGVFGQLSLPASIQIVPTPTVGANKAAFTGWTWSDNAGELADF